MKNLIIILIIFFNLSLISIPDSNPYLREKELIWKPPTTQESKKTEKKIFNWGAQALSQYQKQINGMNITVFSLENGAWIEHKSTHLSASKIDIYGEDGYLAKLNHSVLVKDLEKKITLQSKEAEYDKLTEIVKLKGNPTLEFINDSNQKTIFYSEKITRDIPNKKTSFDGDLTILSMENTILSKDGYYQEDHNKIYLNKNPLMFSEFSHLRSDLIQYDTDSREVILDGNVYGFQYYNETVKDKESTETIQKIRILEASKIIRYIDSNKETNYKMEGGANLIEENSIFHAPNIESIGSNFQIIKAFQPIEYTSIKEHFVLTGKLLYHEKENKYTRISGSPEILFYDKDMKEIKSKIECNELERFEEKKEMVLKGNIQIKSEKVKAYGEFATYYEDQEVLVLEGNPTLDKDGNKVYSGKILFYPKEDRVILSEGIKNKEELIE
jgi:lipopolysaccharide export system protein LptA